MVNLLTERLETVDTIAFTQTRLRLPKTPSRLVLPRSRFWQAQRERRSRLAMQDTPQSRLTNRDYFKPGNAITFAVRDKLYGGTVCLANKYIISPEEPMRFSQTKW